MRLLEVFDMNPRQTKRDMSDHRGRHVMRGGSEIIGEPGSFGSALKNYSEKRIGTVHKIGRAAKLDPKARDGLRSVTTHKEDAYLSYLEMIDSLNHINPFFPRVYDLKVYQDPDGNIFYQVEMEHLSAIRNIDRNNRDLSKQLMNRYFGQDSAIQKETDNLSYALLLASEEPRFRNDIIDENLAEAFDLIENRVIPLGFRWDLGSNNVMMRLTSVGPQPVFTDPVA